MKWIERQRNFLDFTLSSLLRRKSKNGSVLVVYTVIVFVISSAVFFSGAVRKEADALLANSPEMIVQRTLAGRYDVIPLSYAEKIRAMRGVQSVKGRLWGYYYHPASRANYTIMVPDEPSFSDGEIVVGNGVLRTWKAGGDKQFYFKAYDGDTLPLKVARVFSSSTELISSDLILMSEPTFRKLFGIGEGVATDLVVSIRNERECPVVAEKIVRSMPDTRPILRAEILRTYASLFDWRSGYMIILLSGAVLAFFIFAWDKAAGLTAEEKSEIGILKALGWDTSDVLFLKFWEGTVISLTAFLLGVTLAYAHVFLGSAGLFEHALKGWSVLYPRFELSPAIDAYQLATLFALVVVPYAGITLVPAWRVSIADPDAAMR